MMNLGGGLAICVVTNSDSQPTGGGNGIPAKFCQQQHFPLTPLTLNIIGHLKQKQRAPEVVVVVSVGGFIIMSL